MDNVLFSDIFDYNEKLLDKYFRIGLNYDVVATKFNAGGRKAKLYFVDGFINGETSERVMNFMMQASGVDKGVATAEEFAQRLIAYMEIELSKDIEKIAKVVYSGAMLVIVDGFDTGFLVKTRSYPKRSVCEPDNDKVLSGAHDGFVESILINTALIRRRIRDRDLVMEVREAGAKSKTDIAICYLKGKADEKTVD